MAFGWHPALGFMICLLATTSVAAQDPPPLTTLTFDQPLHFLKKDGGDVLLPSGLYRLEATQEHQLRLVYECAPLRGRRNPQEIQQLRQWTVAVRNGAIVCRYAEEARHIVFADLSRC